MSANEYKTLTHVVSLKHFIGTCLQHIVVTFILGYILFVAHTETLQEQITPFLENRKLSLGVV